MGITVENLLLHWLGRHELVRGLHLLLRVERLVLILPSNLLGLLGSVVVTLGGVEGLRLAREQRLLWLILVELAHVLRVVLRLLLWAKDWLILSPGLVRWH